MTVASRGIIKTKQYRFITAESPHRLLSDSSKMLLTYDPQRLSHAAFAAPDSVPYTLVVGHDGTALGTQSGWGDRSLDFIARHVDRALAAARSAAAG